MKYTQETFKKIIEKHPEITPDVPDNRTFCRVSLPYVLQQQKDGSYIALNRNYKPVGFLIEKWVEYAEYPIAVHFKCLREDTIEKLSAQERFDGDIYLYNDGCVPTRRKKHMTAYLEKLAILTKLKVY